MFFEATVHRGGDSSAYQAGREHSRTIGRRSDYRAKRRRICLSLEALVLARTETDVVSERNDQRTGTSSQVANKQYTGDWKVTSMNAQGLVASSSINTA